MHRSSDSAAVAARRLGRIAALLCKALLGLGVLGVAPVARADIDIQISGVDGALRQNVLLFVSLERYRTRNDLDEALVGRLQERAERETAAALRPFGFYAATITSRVERIREGAWRARIDVDPGRPVMLTEVIVQVIGPGFEHPAFRDIVGSPRLRTGERLDHAAYDQVRNTLLRTAATLGYAAAKLTRSELSVDPAKLAARVELVLETGPRYSFGTTLIEQTALDEALLRRYVRFRDGSPFDATQLLRTQFALDDSQFFANVEVVAGQPDAETLQIPVSIRAEPTRRNRYSVGVGYATDSRAHGTLSWENRRLNRRGHRLRTEFKAAQTEQSLEARYAIPLGDPALEKLDFEFRYARDELGDLDTRTTRLQPADTQVLGSWQRVTYVSLNRLRTITPASLTQPAGDVANMLVIPGVSFATVPRGYLGEALFSRALYAELRGSTRSIGAPDNFVQLKIEAERVFDLGTHWHAFVRGQIGATLVSDTAKLPGTERFFAGGDRSVRGFGFNDLSPVDEEYRKIGGRHLFTGTAEVIRDLPRNLGAAMFVDVGNSFDRFGDPLQWSVGVGLRLRLPVVTLGIDLAQPMTNPNCRSATPDPRCTTVGGFKDSDGPRLHLNFSPKL
jgi:translocation and assembly module TamA